MLHVAIRNTELQRFVEEQVSSGHFHSADDVVAAGLALLRSDPDVTVPAKELEELQREIGVGTEQADRKQFSNFTAEDVIAEGMKKLNGRTGN
ncbi:MAG TPA: hypothetical protein VM008_16310 [Phycisphaerae bacterium]|nr:hypothetical protein [Phycisphaerae bacterium]